MNYKQFIEAIQNYWTLRDKGSKKTANEFLSSFVKEFQKNIPEETQDAILFQFCKEYIDEMKYLDDGLRRHLPFPMMEMIKRYLNRECEKIKCLKCDGHFSYLKIIIHSTLKTDGLPVPC